MSTVPLRCVQTYRAVAGITDDLDPESLCTLGRNVEVRLDRLDPAEAEAVLAMWSATRRMWNSARSGGTPTGAWVRTTSTVHHARQDTGRAKVDLHAELVGLGELTEVGDFFDVLLSSDPDMATLAATVAMFDGELEAADGTTTVTLHFTQPAHWPESLGPGTGANEARRTLRVTARHAAWRDRALRRLGEVTVSVDELWATPSGPGVLAA
jgi:hypothetical protein